MTSRTQHRLCKHTDYQRVYKASRKQWAKQVAYFTAAREPGSITAQKSATAGPRVGLTVPKALGKAVDRNRIKRRLRAIVRANLERLGQAPVDVVLHPKRSVLDADYRTLEREVAQIFRAIHGKTAQEAQPAAARGRA